LFLGSFYPKSANLSFLSFRATLLVMKIWIDADACPQVIKDILIKAVLRLKLEAIFVANKPITIPASPHFSFVQIQKGPDIADQYIVEHALSNDLAITQDIPLAAQLVAKGVVVINPHGVLFTESNIGERLANRNLMQELRDTGLITGGPKPFNEKDKRQFANTLDQILTKLLKNAH
jgi:uncharacterized protein